MLLDEDFYKFLIDNTQELVCYHEVSGKYIFVNAYITKITGFSPEELVGKNPYDFFHPDDKEYIQKNGHLPSVKGREDTATEYRFRKKDGSYVWLHTNTKPIKDENGNVINLVTSSRDITQLIQLQDDVEESKALLEEACHLAQIGAWEYDVKERRLKVSTSTYHIFGEKNIETSPESLYSCFSQEGKVAIDKMFKISVESGKSFDIVTSITTTKGKNIWARIVGKPQLSMGNVEKVVGVIQDITRQVASQDSFRTIINSLTTQKDQLKEFSYIVSHNLRSPVANLGLLVRHLGELNSDPESAAYIEHIKKVSDSLAALLNDLVELIKNTEREDIKVEKVDLADAVKKTKLLLHGEMRNLTPKLRCDFTEWSEIEYPRVYLESIVLNLVSNALKYSSPERRPKISLRTYLKGNYKVLSVKDNGLGIDLDKYGHQIFKLNKTFHQNVNGKGMGLYMTKKQIESMGGKIEVSSKVNEGTEFIVYFDREKV